MPKLVTVSCDFCGATKCETNHWYVVRTVLKTTQQVPRFEVMPLTDTTENLVKVQFSCGEVCLVKAMSIYLNSLRGVLPSTLSKVHSVSSVIPVGSRVLAATLETLSGKEPEVRL